MGANSVVSENVISARFSSLQQSPEKIAEKDDGSSSSSLNSIPDFTPKKATIPENKNDDVLEELSSSSNQSPNTQRSMLLALSADPSQAPAQKKKKEEFHKYLSLDTHV